LNKNSSFEEHSTDFNNKEGYKRLIDESCDGHVLLNSGNMAFLLKCESS